jgi:hypothetical protein
MASSAPSGPMIHAQITRDRKVRVSDMSTASPTNFGWITDWITKLMTQ